MSISNEPGINERLRLLYTAQLKQRSEILTQIYSKLKEDAASDADYELLQMEAHKIAGSGTTYGYPSVTAAASPLDLLLGQPNRNVAEVCELVRCLLQAIERVLAGSAEPEASPAPPCQITVSIPPPRGYRPAILVADDDPTIQALLSEIFSSFAIVQVAGTGTAALAALRTMRFDLVLLDHRLPDMDGLSVIGAMRKSGKSAQTVVMMLTAVRDGGEVARLLLAGASDYVVKPFQPESLVRRVNIALRNRVPTVLVADDDRLIREVLRTKFLDRGISVLFASNGIEALEIARTERPQLVVLDIGMPRLDGLGVLRELRSELSTKDTPVVILSARSANRDVSEGMNKGANLYIPKPFLPDDAVGQCAAFLFPPRIGEAA